MNRSGPEIKSLADIPIDPQSVHWCKDVLKTHISEVKWALDEILSAETAISDDVTSPRSFGLVSNTSMAGWRGLLDMCNDEDKVGDFLNILRREGQLRPFVEFILLKIMLARSGMTFKKVSKKIVKDGNGGLLAERYLLWALNHIEGDTKKGPKFTAYAGPHELEPKFSKTAKQGGLGCDAFLSTWLGQGYPNVTFGVQFGVTLDPDIEKGKIESLMAAHKSLKEKNTLLYKRGKQKFLDRFMPDGFILFHAENSLSAFTDPDKSSETIKHHEEWFNKGVKKGTPIDNLDPDTRSEIGAIQESFSGALLAWDAFRKNNENPKGPIKTEKMDMKIGKYHYLVFVDPRMKRAKGFPVRVEVRSSTKNLGKKSVLYSLSVFL